MEALSSMATDSRQQELGVTGILREAFKIPQRNVRLTVSITLLVLLPYSLLVLGHDLAAGPLLDDDSDDGNFDAKRGGVGLLLALELVFLTAFCVISLFAMTLTIYASAATYTGKCDLRLKEAVSVILATWRKPVKTCSCVALMSVAYAFLLLTFVGASSLVATGDAFTASVVFMGSAAALFYVYLWVVWMLGFAVSVVEENCCGMGALWRAAMLVRGRKLHGYFLMLLLLLLCAPISMLLYLNTREDEQGVVARVAVGVAGTVLACLHNIFTFMAFTVFYHECRKYHGEKVLEGDAGYALLSNTVHVANSSP